MSATNLPPDWFGAKRLVKRALELAPLNMAIVGALRSLPPSQWIARVPVAVAEVDARVRDLDFVMTNPKYCTIAKELFWGRGERVKADERTALDVFADLARDAVLIFDVGANTGIFALVGALANEKARVHAFEIVPAVFDVLLQNVLRNDLGHRITCHLEGIGNDGFVMRVPSFARSSSLPTSASILNRDPAEGTRIGFRSLDAVLAAEPDATRLLMKVDVEGGEDVLFEHGTAALHRLQPDILCEVLRGTDPRGVVPSVLSSLGYKFYRIENDVLRRFDRITASAEFHDWLFTKDRARALQTRTRVAVLE